MIYIMKRSRTNKSKRSKKMSIRMIRRKNTRRRRHQQGGEPFYKGPARDFGKDPDLNANDRPDSP